MCQNLHLIFQIEKRKRKKKPSTSCLNRSLDNAADWRTVFHGDKLGFNGQYVYYRNSSVWVSVWCETQRLCVCVCVGDADHMTSAMPRCETGKVDSLEK